MLLVYGSPALCMYADGSRARPARDWDVLRGNGASSP